MGLRGWLLAVVGLALFARLPFLFGIPNPAERGTEDIYLELAGRLASGGGLRGFHFFPPGYPAFVALLAQVPGRTEDAVGVVQHLLGAGLAGAILAAGWRFFGRTAGVIAGVVAALSPLMIWTEQIVLPDLLFGATAFAGTVTLAEAIRRRPDSTRWLIATGALFGAAAWIKPAGQFLLVAAPLAFLICARERRWALRSAAIVCGVLVLTISPWLVRNVVSHGFLGMSNQGGQTLFNRAFERDGLPIPTDVRWGPLVRRVQAAEPEQRLTYSSEAALLERGLSNDEVFDAQGELAKAAIRRHPGTYASGTWRSVKRITALLGNPRGYGLTDERDRVDPPVPRFVTTAMFRLSAMVTSLWWLLSLNTLAGLLVFVLGDRRAKEAAAALLAVFLAIVVGTALTHGGNVRYGIHLAPMAWLLGSAGIALVASAVLRARRARA